MVFIALDFVNPSQTYIFFANANETLLLQCHHNAFYKQNKTKKTPKLILEFNGVAVDYVPLWNSCSPSTKRVCLAGCQVCIINPTKLLSKHCPKVAQFRGKNYCGFGNTAANTNTPKHTWMYGKKKGTNVLLHCSIFFFFFFFFIIKHNIHRGYIQSKKVHTKPEYKAVNT